MNRTLLPLSFAVLSALCAGPSARAAIVTFGSGANQFNMEFAAIGYPGNAADTTGDPNPAGAVNYIYLMGKFEVSRDMITKANAEGSLGITMDDMTSFSSGNGANRPATGVTWNETARFVNWLNTSQGYLPAYKFAFQPGEDDYNPNEHIELWTDSEAGYNAANPYRNSLAHYFLPSVDEWYKAAYYDPDTSTYFDYPAGNTPPTTVPNGNTAGTAVYGQSFYQGPADIFDAGGLNYFGIMGMAGNVYEWTETARDLINDFPWMSRISRGGSWLSDPIELSSSVWYYSGAKSAPTDVGIRVASVAEPVPEPSTLVLATFGIVGVLLWGVRRKGP